MSQKGFTLIELLVVISIIGLLSSVILASTNQARMNARDAKRNALVIQYKTAFELAYQDYGQYPQPSAGPAIMVCLGSGNPGGKCGSGGITEDPSVNSILSKYIPGPPASSDPVILFGNNQGGLYYSCYGLPSTDCKQGYQVQWYLEGHGSCASGATKTIIAGYDYCILNVFANK